MKLKIATERLALFTYVSEKHERVLSACGLQDFKQTWGRPVAWVEAPNETRGGWSGVGRLQLDADGSTLNLYVKKQQNYSRFSLLHPIRGEPTFKREYDRLQYLADHHIGAPKVVLYGKKVIENNLRAILATEELEGYLPLDLQTAAWFAKDGLARGCRRKRLQEIASFVRRFHEQGLVHRALYPKHIFAKESGGKLELALIDLEKSRLSPFFWYRSYYDLASLNRHAEHWSRADRLYFFKQYCRIERLGTLSKWLCRMLMKRSQRK